MTYLPEWELKTIREIAQRSAYKARAQSGAFPVTLSISLPLDDSGSLQEPVDFLLVECTTGRAVYETVGPIEAEGVPNGCVRVEVNIF